MPVHVLVETVESYALHIMGIDAHLLSPPLHSGTIVTGDPYISTDDEHRGKSNMILATFWNREGLAMSMIEISFF
jgi:hypothetical protein